MESLRLNHYLVHSQGSPREEEKWLRFTRDSEWGTTGEMCTLLIPVQARAVEYDRIVWNSNDIVHDEAMT